MPYQMSEDVTKNLEEFISTGRSGRRNALHDIHEIKAGNTSTADLPNSLDKLQCSDGDTKENKAASSTEKPKDSESKEGGASGS